MRTEKLQAVGILFTDNDFNNTCRAFLRTILFVGIESYDHLTKEQFLELFRRSAPGLYWLAQNRLKYGVNDKHTEDYIRDKLTVDHIYFNDEVDAYLKSGPFFNGEFFVLDARPHEPYVYVV